MFKDYNDKFPPYELQKVSGKHIKAVKDAVFAAIGKRKAMRLKPLIVTVTAIISVFALGTGANAATGGALVKFFMGGNEVEAYVDDYVDDEGCRHLSFYADIPIEEVNFAVIFDDEAQVGENVRVLTDETDPAFMDQIRGYNSAKKAAWERKKEETGEASGEVDSLDPDEFGLTFKDSEICMYSLEYIDGLRSESAGGNLGGEFMNTGTAEGNPSGSRLRINYDYENGVKTYRYTLYYYVGEDN